MKRGFWHTAVGLLTVTAFLAPLPFAAAAKIDPYREILRQGAYTIRYDNLTPAPRVTNRDRADLYGKSALSVERSDYLLHRQTKGVITAADGDRYEEVGDDKFVMCRLSKGGEDFFFTRYKKGDKTEYYGTGRNRVEANEKNYFAELVEGKSYGDADMSALINAIMPDGEKSAKLGRYRLAAAGKLKDGGEYEDYRAVVDGKDKVIRYYFNGDKLARIASASYSRRGDGKIDGRKCIINIREFSATPDKTLLKLPEGLKDDTKRKAKNDDKNAAAHSGKNNAEVPR